MLTPFLEWILDLKNIHLSTDRPLLIKWLMPLPPWLVFTLGLVLAAAVVLTYRREDAPLRRRIVLLVPRLALIALVLAMVCHPVLIWQRNWIEPAVVTLLVDNSSSMNRADGAWGPGSGPDAWPRSESGPTRLDRVREELSKDDAAALRSLLAHNQVSLVSFDRGTRVQTRVQAREPADPLVDALAKLDASGGHTELFAALNQTLTRSQAGPLAAIVLATDGQSTESGGLESALERARAQKVPIYPVRVGSPVPPLDLSLAASVKDRQVFAGDRVAIGARVSARGLSGPVEGVVDIIDEASGNRVAGRTVQLSPEAPVAELEMLVHVERQSQVRYRATVHPLPGEKELENNSVLLAFDVIEEPLKVLYVEGYPRFEYRYLKNAYLREESISVSCLLLSADSDFAQEGDEPIRRFPQNQEEMDRYDVVLFGDVDVKGDWWTPSQADLLVEFVRRRGGGFGVIAGEKFIPQRLPGTVLEKLAPIRVDPRFQGRYTASLTDPYHIRLTPEGRENRVFRFFDDPNVNAATLESLPGMYWIAQSLGPKPGSEVLSYHDSMRTLSGPMPLIVQGRFGAGTVMFIGSDDFWQWRRHNGETLHDAFWVQVARSLAPATPSDADPRLTLIPSKPDYSLGEPVEILLRVRDADLLGTLGDEVALQAGDESDAPVINTKLVRVSPDSGDYSVTLRPGRPGRYTLRLPEIAPATSAQAVRAAFEVVGFERELEHPEANHEVLRRLAEETGGAVVELNEMAEVFDAIPDRSIQTPDDVTEALWDSKLVLILFVSIITFEWIGRKVAGML